MTVLDPQRTAIVLVDLMPRLLELPMEPRFGEVVRLSDLDWQTTD